MKPEDMFDERGILTEKGLIEIEKKASGVSCECPEHLIQLLKSAKEFTSYQDDCLIESPSDEMTHQWLKSTSLNLEHLISATIVNLARLEGLIDENNKVVDS